MSKSWLILKEDYDRIQEMVDDIENNFGDDDLIDDLRHWLSTSMNTSPIDPGDFAEDSFSILVHQMYKEWIGLSKTEISTTMSAVDFVERLLKNLRELGE